MKKYSESFSPEQGESDMALPVDMKMAAGLSLALWVAVIVFGRFISYVE